MSKSFADAGGDASTRHWFKDRPTFCNQTLSPYEMGLVDRPKALSESPEEQRHPLSQKRWELPTCNEPVAPGYNPLKLCALHLALSLEMKRKRGEVIFNPKMKGSGLIIDFVDNPVFAEAAAQAEREREIWFAEKAKRAEAARIRMEELRKEGQEALARVAEARRALAEAEAKEAEESAAKAEAAKVEAPSNAATSDVTEGNEGAAVASEGASVATGATGAETHPAEASKPKKPRKPKAPRSAKEATANTEASQATTKMPKAAKAKPLKAPEGPSRHRKDVPEQRNLF